ncbi:MAG: hypothetical protein IKS51_06285 [Erysipelotrichaceae bacterium]|nr:hypothetical protein [Erysipelotrichaceae bacterium]
MQENDRISDNVNDRHAYMIMAHHNFDQLCRLLELLDDERNDICLHIDKKSRNVPYEKIRSSLKKAKLYPVRRINVTWGGFSMVRCAYLLMEEAARTKHAYYHMLTGVDLPLKSQNEIHDFFRQNRGKEFINLDKKMNSSKKILHRHEEFRFLQDIIGRKEGRLYDALRWLEDLSMKVQRRLGIKRNTKGISRYYKGSAYFSVTDDFIRYVLSQKKMVRRLLNHSLFSDEFVIQTLAMNSEFKDRIVADNYRYIDWKRKPGDGGPYTFTVEDYDALIQSDRLFARKFDENKDNGIILKICDYVRNRQQ